MNSAPSYEGKPSTVGTERFVIIGVVQDKATPVEDYTWYAEDASGERRRGGPSDRSRSGAALDRVLESASGEAVRGSPPAEEDVRRAFTVVIPYTMCALRRADETSCAAAF